MTKKEVLKLLSAKNEEEAKRNLYKHTNCGAFLEFKRGRIIIGSIVEGSDFGTTTFDIKYKDVNRGYIENVISRIENEASQIWDWANVERDNGKTDMENGIDFPLL